VNNHELLHKILLNKILSELKRCWNKWVNDTTMLGRSTKKLKVGGGEPSQTHIELEKSDAWPS
jgi:hypothetical protein